MQIIASDAEGEWSALVALLEHSRGELRRTTPLSVPIGGAPVGIIHALTALSDQLPPHGIVSPRRVVLVSSEHPEYAGEMIPDEDGGTSFVPVTGSDITPSLVALITGAVAMTRWRHGWNGWCNLLTSRSLRELIYVDGIGRCAAAALLPEAPEHRLLGLSPVQLRRVEERERSLTPRLLRDLDSTATIGWLRWLAEGTGEAARRDENGVIPQGAGRYLARRFTMRRVERIGIAGSIAAEAESISPQ